MTEEGKPSSANLRDLSSVSSGLAEQWVFLYVSEIPQTPLQAHQLQPCSLFSSMGYSRPLITFMALWWSLSRLPASLFLGIPDLDTAPWGGLTRADHGISSLELEPRTALTFCSRDTLLPRVQQHPRAFP